MAAASAATVGSDEKDSIVVNALETLASECYRILKSSNKTSQEGREILYKCRDSCNQCLAKKNTSLKSKIQQYAKAMLDFTFYTESILTENDFPEDSSEEQVAELLKQLEKPIELSQQIFPDKQIAATLGDEVHECIRWRQGALLYMLCSTVNQDDNRRNRNKDRFIQNLLKGMHYLSEMFLVRESNDDYSRESDQTILLIKEGIYSDTHVLSLMYKGEMCYWYLQSSDQQTQTNSERSIDPVVEGKKALETFVRTTEGPLRMYGWSSDKAKELLTSPYFT